MGQQKYFITTMLVADIDKRAISEKTLSILKTHADYTDTDSSLNEFLISTGTLSEIVDDIVSVDVRHELFDLIRETDNYSYIRFLSI
jgi:hypothetical protein